MLRFTAGQDDWEYLPPTSLPRQRSACGVVTDVDTGKQYVMAAGGAGIPSSSGTTEMLDLDTLEWSEGNDRAFNFD